MSNLLSSLSSVWDPSHGMVPSIFQPSLPSLVKPLWKHPERYVSMVTLNPTKLMMGINQHDMCFRKEKVRTQGFCIMCEKSRKEGPCKLSSMPPRQEKGSLSKTRALYGDPVVLSVLNSEQKEGLGRPWGRKRPGVLQKSGKKLVDNKNQQTKICLLTCL